MPSVQILAPVDTVVVDSTLQLTAEFRDAEGRLIDGVDFEWSSSDPGVAIVDPATGLLTGVSVGSANITAARQGVSDTVSLNVVLLLQTCGRIVTGTISVPGEVDLFRMDGRAGDFITLTLVETEGFPTQFQAARLTVFPLTGDSVLTFTSGGQRDFVLPVDGPFVLRVSGAPASTTGSYRLGLACLDPTGGTALALSPGDLAMKEIAELAQVDVLTFSGIAGDFLTLSIGETAGFPGMFQSARVTVYSPSRDTVLALNTSSRRDFTLPETGDYRFRVGADPISVLGAYNIGIEGIDPVSPDARALSFGTVHSDTIEHIADVDMFTLAASSGDRVTVSLVETSGFPTQFQAANVTIFSPGRDTVLAFNSSQEQTITLTETGVYSVRVAGAPVGTTGTYNLSFTRF